MSRTVLSAAIAAVLLSLAVIGSVLAVDSVQFRLGFKALADQVPQVAGQPLEDEHWADNGDSLQQTTTGLMVWRKADNWTAFTNGSRTWVNGPFGVMERSNDERFDWEAGERSPEAETGTRAVPSARGAPPRLSPPQSPEAAAEQAALDMINRSRQENGSSPVVMDAALQEVARAHARDMADRGFFGHVNPDGLQAHDRLRAAGISYSAMAENVGWSQGYPSPTDGVRMNHQKMMAETPPNDGHRVNILNPRLTRVGIGVYGAPDGKIYYVTDFAG